jgi:hypothetical protein
LGFAFEQIDEGRAEQLQIRSAELFEHTCGGGIRGDTRDRQMQGERAAWPRGAGDLAHIEIDEMKLVGKREMFA